MITRFDLIFFFFSRMKRHFESTDVDQDQVENHRVKSNNVCRIRDRIHSIVLHPFRMKNVSIYSRIG